MKDNSKCKISLEKLFPIPFSKGIVSYTEKGDDRMQCPRCHSENCYIINEVTTKGKDYSAGKGCLGYLIFGTWGLLCGACGEGKTTTNTNYWVCNNCGKKWRA